MDCENVKQIHGKRTGPQSDCGGQRIAAVRRDAVEAFAERHYTVDELASMWKLSHDSVRRLFRHEPGVLAVSPRQRRGSRAYVTLRIPASVVERVHRRLTILVR